MPIKIPATLPAAKTLEDENIFVMTTQRAETQNIRPLQILLLNLMPTKIQTETHFARMLGNTPLQVELELMQVKNHVAKNISKDHMVKFYSTFDDIKDRYFDGMVITGAPLELLEYEQVDYWDELCSIMEWSKSHVFSTFHVCWGAQAGLFYHYGIKKHKLDKKISGIYPHHALRQDYILLRGFDDVFMVPHSRHTEVKYEDVKNCKDLKIVASSDEVGLYICMTDEGRQIFVMGHSEYDKNTLFAEYKRDLEAGKNPPLPKNYFIDDNPELGPKVTWRGHANLLYQNWLNYFVYQQTPFKIDTIKSL